ncbi:hypothetical protein J7K93_02975 [bacterium]|nr:hypothetical protein [bacterium]
MNYNEFRTKMKLYPVFSVREIRKLFPGFDSRRLVEWQERGYIEKLRNSFYCFKDIETEEQFLSYLANVIYRPSYVSLESALSVYGFIPEHVFQTISCTTLKTQIFNTKRGRFVYHHLKPKFHFGYKFMPWKNFNYLIAEPEKALIDYLYLHPEIKNVSDIDSLRWNVFKINDTISLSKLDIYCALISSAALEKRIILLKEFLNVES